MLSLICALNKRLSNNWEACDLRRHRAHYDVIIGREGDRERERERGRKVDRRVSMLHCTALQFLQQHIIIYMHITWHIIYVCLSCNAKIEVKRLPYSVSGKTSYRQISSSLAATRLDLIMMVSLWNLTGMVKNGWCNGLSPDSCQATTWTMLTYCQMDLGNQFQRNFNQDTEFSRAPFYRGVMIWKRFLRYWSFVRDSPHKVPVMRSSALLLA